MRLKVKHVCNGSAELGPMYLGEIERELQSSWQCCLSISEVSIQRAGEGEELEEGNF